MRFLSSIFIVIFSLITTVSYTQDILKGRNLTTLKIDDLTDAQIAELKVQLQQNGLSESQAEQLALQKGLPSVEVAKLRVRLANTTITGTNKNSSSNNKNIGRSIDSNLLSTPYQNNTIEKENRFTVFGSELFNNPTPIFEPNLRIATPKNYSLGPDDEVVIDIFGYQEANYRLTVSAEGSINIPFIGVVPVVGLTVEQATKKIKDKMTKNGYAGLSSGQTQLQVSIGKIRSIKISVIGEAKKPGTYSISSLSTLFNALYAAGGITNNGSFRQIELIRNNKLLLKLDAYDFLLKGNQSNNIRLVDQDVVRIPSAINQVILKGEVKREGIFELLTNNNLQQLIDFSGGFTSEAYTANIQVKQINGKERVIKDIAFNQINSYQPQRGDSIIVGKIINRFIDNVQIKGAVYRPGMFQWQQGLTLTQLIAKADGVKEEAFKERGLIIRTNEANLSKQSIAFSLEDIITKKATDILLSKYDEVFIGAANNYTQQYTITLEGEVKNPGVYPFFNAMVLSDVLFLADGFTDASSPNKIEIARRTSSDKDSVTTEIATIIEVSAKQNLQFEGKSTPLQPWDLIVVRKKPNYTEQVSIKIEGEVKYPGNYILSQKEERISDVLKRAGGLNIGAFIDAASLVRVNKSYLKELEADKIKKIQKNTKDTSNALVESLNKTTIRVGLHLKSILDNPKSVEDVILQEGDVLVIPKQKNEIKLSGEVMLPSEVVYNSSFGVKDYIASAGGYTENASERKVYVLYPNGTASRVKKFLFFKKYPNITAGSEIFVPAKPPKASGGLSTAELIGLTSGVASLAGVVIAILRR